MRDPRAEPPMNHEVNPQGNKKKQRRKGEDGVTEMGDRNGEDWSHWAEKEKERGVTDMMKEREKERKRNIILMKRREDDIKCYAGIVVYMT